jgi:RHS repeat-associated protein
VRTWQWAAGSTLWGAHSVERDLAGRIRRIWDPHPPASFWSDVRYTYDGDGDVLSERDESIGPTWLRRDATDEDVTVNYGYHSSRDRMTSWTSVDGSPGDDFIIPNTLTLDANIGRPTFLAQTGIGTSSYSYGYGNVERLTGRTGSAFGNITLTYNIASGEVKGFDRAPFQSGDDMSLAYGPRGELDRVEVAGLGVYDSYYDAQLHRVKRTYPAGSTGGPFPIPITGAEKWSYGVDGRLLEYRRNTDHSTEYIWLAGEVVGLVTGVSQTGMLFHAYPDRMGVTRKVSTLNGTRVNRLIMDPWARGYVQNDDGNASDDPTLGMRYPGQWEDVDVGIVFNGARALLPDVGAYTTPEPLHQVSLAAYGATGPLAYSYAAGNPLKYTDSTGMEIDGGWDMALAMELVTPEQVAGYETAAMEGSLLGLGAVVGAELGISAAFTSLLNPATPARLWLAARWASITGGTTRLLGGGCADRAEDAAIQFGKGANQIQHAFRHTTAMGLDPAAVQLAVRTHLAPIASQVVAGRPFNQIIQVAGQAIQYTAYLLPDGTINVGRIHGAP